MTAYVCNWCRDAFPSHRAREAHVPGCAELALATLDPTVPRPYYCVESWGAGSRLTLRHGLPDPAQPSAIRFEGYRTQRLGVSVFLTVDQALRAAAHRRKRARQRAERMLKAYVAAYGRMHEARLATAHGALIEHIEDPPDAAFLDALAAQLRRLRARP
jgi:hypothetical protein